MLDNFQIGEIHLTEANVKKLKNFGIDPKVSNTESVIKVYKTIPNGVTILLKMLYDTRNIESKIDTIKKIRQNEELLAMDEIVLPTDVVISKGESIGFAIPEIKNSTNLGLILQDPKVSIKYKMDLLYKVSKLLSKTLSLNDNFYFNDLHEFNFLVDENDNIKVIDIDSSSINSNKATPSYYLVTDPKLTEVPKYKFNEVGLPYSGRDCDIYCYNIMLMNTLANYQIQKLTFLELSDYLDYLLSIGIDETIIDSIINLYTTKPNELITTNLNDINCNLYQARYSTYKQLKEMEVKKTR